MNVSSVAVLTVLLVNVLGIVRSDAASVKRIEGGRIEIDALDQRLVFREEDVPGLLLTSGDSEKCDPKAFRTTVYRWLHDDAFGACLNQTLPDHDEPHGVHSVSFDMQELKFQDGLIYPGGNRSEALPKSSFGFGMFDVTIRDTRPAGGPSYFDSNKGWVPFASGYERNEIPGLQGVYRLPADRRLGHATRPLEIGCGTFTCGLRLKSLDNTAKVDLVWSNEDTDKKTGKLGPPNPAWVKYDEVVRAMADAIFVFNQPGYLQ